MMNKRNVVAILDVGRTHKKILFFDEDYQKVYESESRLQETRDEDGDPCEDITALSCWARDEVQSACAHSDFLIKALNFCSYGASMVYIDPEGQHLTPLYNYLKPYPKKLLKQFYEANGGVEEFSRITASPALGSLNSGLQFYRLVCQHPEVFRRIYFALHLPQYLSYLFTKVPASELTSIGCHTGLWDYSQEQYHDWVARDGILAKLAPLFPSSHFTRIQLHGKSLSVGVGLHDSSAALIPYLREFSLPFLLISTGTWNISMNPFNSVPLTQEELKSDCLLYKTYEGNSVKASRLLAGPFHEEQTRRISEFFHMQASLQNEIRLESGLFKFINGQGPAKSFMAQNLDVNSPWEFSIQHLDRFASFEEAYFYLIKEIAFRQFLSTSLVIQDTKPTQIFVDGGFSRNVLFMQLLSWHFPKMEVFAASVGQGSALGAAIAIHESWNHDPLPNHFIEKKQFKVSDQGMPI